MRPAIRPARGKDIPALLRLQHDCYPFLSTLSQWRAEHLQSHLRHFAEGQFVGEDEDRIVAHCATFRTTSAVAMKPHSFREITHRGTFDGHVPEGDVLYGAEIMVHPDFRRRGLAKRLYEARFALIKHLNIRYFVAGGRMPGYVTHAKDMTPKQYVKAVLDGKVEDRVMSAQLKSGLEVRGVLPDYLNDPKSLNNATLLVWENPDWVPPAKAKPPK